MIDCELYPVEGVSGVCSVWIRTYDRGMAFIRTSSPRVVYDYMREIGYSHKDAAEVSSWAENAPVDSVHEIDGADIRIVDGTV